MPLCQTGPNVLSERVAGAEGAPARLMVVINLNLIEKCFRFRATQKEHGQQGDATGIRAEARE